MNTITIERSLLEQVLDAIQELEHASTAVADKKARDAKSNLRAALAAPATTPECKTSGGDARAVALARLLDQAYERGVAVGLSQAVPATAPEHLDPADLCDVCKEPVRYGSRHHACGEAMLRAKANAAPATAPEKTVQEIMEFARHYAANTFSSATLEDKIRRSLAAPAHQEQLKPGECWPERIMKQWDEMRDLISKGDKSSLPRDWFESLAEMRLIDAPDDRVKELEAELAATEIAIAEYRQQCLDNAAEIARLRATPATAPEQPRPFIPWSKEAEMLESWAAQPAPQPERKPMHEGEIQAAWLGQDLDEPIPYSFVLGIRSAERFNGIKETP